MVTIGCLSQSNQRWGGKYEEILGYACFRMDASRLEQKTYQFVRQFLETQEAQGIFSSSTKSMTLLCRFHRK
jgi:hypothetical protein